MDKTEFLEVLRHYASTSVEEAKTIASLRVQYPYSQLLQTLAARSSKDHGFQHQQRDLQVAAVYAADRGLLKEIITLQPEEPVQQVVSKHVDADRQVASVFDSVDVADVVLDDLDRLAKLKDAFENLFMDYPKSLEKGATTAEPDAAIQRTKIATTDSTPRKSESEEKPASAKSSTKSKKQRIIEMAKALNGNLPKDETPPAKKKHRDGHANPADELIDEIQKSKEEITPENEHQKQQIEIINQFIRVQPSISNARDRAPSAIGDLTTIKSGEFGDNIVSETLVEILVKQGKKDKAIEVLKKLIWKYPQKKAYFASQIEDLKK